MSEYKKLFNKWMVIPFNNELYEKLNESDDLSVILKDKISDEEKKLKYNEFLAKKNKHINDIKPEAIIKTHTTGAYKDTQIQDIKSDTMDDTVINESFNDTTNYMDSESVKEDPNQIITEAEPKISFIPKQIKTETEAKIKVIPIKLLTNKPKPKTKRLNKKLTLSHVNEYFNILDPKNETPALNTRSQAIKRIQKGKNIFNWTIYKNNF
jgi:hypothetical protein